ncbi:MAG: multiprotein bridging factor aMBF1 [Candidatus Odinarchaeia archaeon]
MSCEICGKEGGKLYYVCVEGIKVRVCERCARFGTQINEEKEKVRKPKVLSVKKPVKKIKEEPVYEYELVKDFPVKIKTAREQKKLKQDELAKLIKEKPSTIRRIEAGRLTPNEELIKKIEKALNIKLRAPMVIGPEKTYTQNKKELTLGDIVKIKIKEKK